MEKIFSVTLSGDSETPRTGEDKIAKIREDVNEFLKGNPQATTLWLQSSAANLDGFFTQLTAIVSYKLPY